MKFFAHRDLFNNSLYVLSLLVLLLPYFFMGFSIFYTALYVLFALLFSWLYFYIYYELTESGLKLVIGPIKFSIDYSAIKKVSKVKKFTASFHTAINAVEVQFGISDRSRFNKIYISPKKEEEFLAALFGKLSNGVIKEDRR